MEHMKLIELTHAGDKEAREQLISGNLGLVWSIVRRFANRGYELEDLFQIGSIGLMKAIDHFDTSFEVKFSTYAVPMITGEIKRFLRDDGMIRVSRSLKELATTVCVCRERLIDEWGREPTLSEIAKELDVTIESVVTAMEASSEVESLNKVIYQGDGNAICLSDKIEDANQPQEKVVNHMALEKVMKSLDEKERELIDLRYYQEKTQTDIARQMGISQVQVSRLEKKILKSMRDMLA